MNEVRHRASGWVQRAARKVVSMIDEPGHPTGHLVIAQEETTMLKTISAALLAVSVLAAPALAAASDNAAQAPVVKTMQVKPSVLNANAKMGRHHRHHKHHRHHRIHKQTAALKKHQSSKFAIKHVTHAKRG